MNAFVARFVVCSSLILQWLPAWAFPVTNQFQLVAGWNAIWLEVDVRDSQGNLIPPDQVFATKPITTVATYFPEEGPMEFYTNQVEASLTQEGWATWRSNNPSGTNTLSALMGMRAYLIKASSSCTWYVTNEPSFHVYRWIPDSYNLVGFGLLQPTSFQTVFGTAGEALDVTNIYQLQGGTNWTAVQPTDLAQPGAAYWVYAKGRPTYQGPLLIDIPGTAELDYGTDTVDQEVLFHNATASTIRFQIDREGPTNGLELIQVLASSARPGTREGGAIVNFQSDPLAGQQSVVLTFRVNRSAANWASATNRQLYRVSSPETGTYCWLPVTAVRSDRLPTAASSTPVADSHGLWVGEVSIQSVSRHYPEATNSGLPYPEPVTAAPKGRILFHVNASGEVKLLKAVTLMRRKGVDGAAGETVLVVNPDKIPYLQGIEKRNGRLVGKRIETTFYDLPRAGTTNAADQVYYTSLPFTGGLGPDNRCSGSLTLDTYHRANPFRHPYHPDFMGGPNLTRVWTITFDPANDTLLSEYPEYGHNLLTGSFQETVSGLVRDKETIAVTGRLLIRRLNDCPTLQ